MKKGSTVKRKLDTFLDISEENRTSIFVLQCAFYDSNKIVQALISGLNARCLNPLFNAKNVFSSASVTGM